MARRTRSSLPLGAPLVVAAIACGCFGSGTTRVDAPCREMRSGVAYEMLKDNPSIPLLDVRAPTEVTEREGRLARARQISLEQLPVMLPELEVYRDRTIIVFGAEGGSGRRACEFLSGRGFRWVVFVVDGAPGLFRGGFERLSALAMTPTPTPPAAPVAFEPPPPEPTPLPSPLPEPTSTTPTALEKAPPAATPTPRP